MISGVVLAAGTGSRFGGTKQIAVVDGKPLAQHAIDTLSDAGVDEIVVVTGHDAVHVAGALTLPGNARIVYNPAFKDGQATSLSAGLHALDDRSEGAVVLMADQPGVTADVVRSLVRRFLATRTQIVRAMYRDGPGPSLLSREIYGEAGHLTGDVGARELIASHPTGSRKSRSTRRPRATWIDRATCPASPVVGSAVRAEPSATTRATRPPSRQR